MATTKYFHWSKGFSSFACSLRLPGCKIARYMMHFIFCKCITYTPCIRDAITPKIRFHILHKRCVSACVCESVCILCAYIVCVCVLEGGGRYWAVGVALQRGGLKCFWLFAPASYLYLYWLHFWFMLQKLGSGWFFFEWVVHSRWPKIAIVRGSVWGEVGRCRRWVVLSLGHATLYFCGHCGSSISLAELAIKMFHTHSFHYWFFFGFVCVCTHIYMYIYTYLYLYLVGKKFCKCQFLLPFVLACIVHLCCCCISHAPFLASL